MPLPEKKFTKNGVTDSGYEMLPAVTSSDNGKSMVVKSGAWEKDDILPAVTTSDNGKILKVVSGKWAAASAS